ncbi:MAG: YopX family protein [Clostridium sp.]|uniref:YopX family protein n=1 Tax=Clostridium sp. TaxID=1506 RepID=UPI003F2C804E
MRKIKFRGLSIETNEWVYGFYYEVPAPLKCIGKQDDPKGYIVMVEPNRVFDWVLPITMVAVEVDIKTVGQYIEMNDKNNIEIYEGDILKDAKGNIDKVIHLEYMFDLNSFYDTGYDIANQAFSEGAHIYEVVGNIYENTELAKEIDE